MNLDPVDAMELGELLQLIRTWLAVDPTLRASLGAFIGHPAYNIPELQADLDRFTLLIGGSTTDDDDELHFTPDFTPDQNPF